MDKKILLVLAGLLTIGIVGMAVISSYGSITGYATVEKGITIDIYGSSNDENYTLKSVHQGEIEYSPKIKIDNRANVNFIVNVTTEVVNGDKNSVNLSIVNEYKNETLTNPITIPTSNLYFYVKHEFQPNAELGNYTFKIDVIPA